MAVSKETQKLDLVDLRDKASVLREALEGFLQEHSLSLSAQNRERAFQHLLSCMADYKSLSAEDVRGYLNEVLEYHAHNIDMMNKTGIAEDSLVNILITADYDTIIRPNVKQWKFGWRSLPMPVAVSLVLIIGASFAKPTLFTTAVPDALERVVYIEAPAKKHVAITRAQEEEIKTLVHALSEKSGESYIKIYNRIKALPEVTQFGVVRSYKKFNYEQYLAAKTALKTWVNQ